MEQAVHANATSGAQSDTRSQTLFDPAHMRVEVCGALNVTVSPGPVVDYLEGENATLLCHISQKRRKDSLLAVRWFFARPNSQEALMVKMTKLGMVQYYGNYSRSAFRQRLCLLEERRGALYTLSVLTLQPADQGHYVCKVQEISKHRNKWTAWSNGSSATEMRVISLQASEDSSFEKKKETWAFFEDIYIYAVLVCCLGILSVLLFTLTIIWQSVFSKRKSRVRHYLVKCPQNSSGETVTSVTSLAPLQPKKGKRRKEKADVPPAVPAKAPIAATFHKPKLLKPQRKVTLPLYIYYLKFFGKKSWTPSIIYLFTNLYEYVYTDINSFKFLIILLFTLFPVLLSSHIFV
ncbi:V-set and transmembrane domain-containing protein 4 isoform X1 [Suricata suricatta]|uniref:V-set and transmembrane domain-containing protein 4 isoform X1 n=1 Tax=Suricata suricatta TaxID=37032 RepID=UPI00115546FB|nr:V-set and transmembrane domain-containing protein 4 isoform X1 [Suricata suricatta]